MTLLPEIVDSEVLVPERVKVDEPIPNIADLDVTQEPIPNLYDASLVAPSIVTFDDLTPTIVDAEEV